MIGLSNYIRTKLSTTTCKYKPRVFLSKRKSTLITSLCIELVFKCPKTNVVTSPNELVAEAKRGKTCANEPVKTRFWAFFFNSDWMNKYDSSFSEPRA